MARLLTGSGENGAGGPLTEGPSPSAHRAAEPRPTRHFFTAPLSRVGARGAESSLQQQRTGIHGTCHCNSQCSVRFVIRDSHRFQMTARIPLCALGGLTKCKFDRILTLCCHPEWASHQWLGARECEGWCRAMKSSRDQKMPGGRGRRTKKGDRRSSESVDTVLPEAPVLPDVYTKDRSAVHPTRTQRPRPSKKYSDVDR